MTATPILEMREITRRFGSFYALKGVDLTVYPGEVIAKRPVGKILPDKHPQKVAPQLLTAVQQARPLNAIDRKEEQIVEQHRQRQQPKAAQIARLRGKQRAVLRFEMRNIRYDADHAVSPTTRRRNWPESVSSSDTTIRISSKVMLTWS